MNSAQFRGLKPGDMVTVFGLHGTVKTIDRRVMVRLSDRTIAWLYEDAQSTVHETTTDPLAHEIPSPETLADNCPVCGGSRKLEYHAACSEQTARY